MTQHATGCNRQHQDQALRLTFLLAQRKPQPIPPFQYGQHQGLMSFSPSPDRTSNTKSSSVFHRKITTNISAHAQNGTPLYQKIKLQSYELFESYDHNIDTCTCSHPHFKEATYVDYRPKTISRTLNLEIIRLHGVTSHWSESGSQKWWSTSCY